MPSLVFDVSALDRASQAFERIANRVDFLIARIAALGGMSANPRLDVDTDPADRTLGRWAMDFKRRTREALAEIPTVDIAIRSSLTDVEQDVQRVRDELATLLNKDIGIDISAEDAIAEIERLKAQLRDLDTSDADVRVKTDVAAALAALEAVLAKAREVDQSDPTVDVKVDQKGFRDIINAAALFQRSIMQIARGPGLVIAIPGIVSLLDSLDSLLGLLGLLPGLAFGAIAAVAALGVAFNGVGEALGAMDDAAKFEEALKKLTPAAAATVRAIAGLRDEFTALRQATQEAFFTGLEGQVTRFATVIPTLQAGLQGIAAGFSTVAQAWADWAFSMPATIQLGQIFENIRQAVVNLAPGITAVAQALTDMALVGARMLPQLAQGFSDAATDFAAWIDTITANGQFEAWIRGAMETLGQLTDIVGNTYMGFQGLFDAMAADGQTFLTTIQGWAAAFREFTQSAEGQEKLIAFFTALSDIGAAIGPGIAGVLATIAATIVTAAPAAQALGEAFTVMVGALGPGVVIFGGFLSALTPIVDGIAMLVAALGPLPAIALAGFLAFRAAGTILGAFSATLLFVVPAIERLGLALIGLSASAGIGTALGGLGLALGAVGTALRGVAAFLTGPWGFAILAAVAALTLLTGGSGDAADAAREHQQAVQSLAGSLDQYTGSITKATEMQIAQDLASRKLSDGTTSLATAVQQAGINFDDYAAAASGNGVALEKVNAQLVAQATTVIQGSAAWDEYSGAIARSGAPMEVVAAAALGNKQAMQELHDVYGMTTPQVERMTERFQASLGPLAEVGQILGATNGALVEAQNNTRLAAMAVADWGTALTGAQGAMTQFGAAINQTTGEIDAAAPGATQLVEAFDQLAFAALAAATNAGTAAAAINGLGAGGLAAAQSMAASREAFIGMATSAGLGAEAAGRLADALGLIPAAAELIFTTNATEAEAEIINLVARIQALGNVPATITVEALTEQAQAALELLGVTITELPDGQMLLSLDDSQFKAQLEAAIASGQTLPEIIAQLGLDTTGADQTLGEWQASATGQALATPISFTTKLDTAPAQADYDAFAAQAQTPLPPVPFDIDAAPAQGKLDGFKAQAAVPMIVPLDADPSLANGKLATLLGAVAGSVGVMTIDANEAPAMGKLAATVAAVNGALGTMTIDGDNGPALAALAAAVGAVNGATGTMTIDGDAGPAIAAARAAVAQINGMSATITVTTVRRTVEVGASVGAGGGRFASGGMIPRFARGGIVPGYAPGIDKVPALLSPGEGILVPEAVRLLGARAVANLNKLASSGRRSSFMSKNGNDAYTSFGTASGRSAGGYAMENGRTMVKNYYLTVENAANSEVDLREQFRRMEVLGL